MATSSIEHLAATVTAVAIQSQPEYFPQFKDLDNPDAVTHGIPTLIIRANLFARKFPGNMIRVAMVDILAQIERAYRVGQCAEAVAQNY